MGSYYSTSGSDDAVKDEKIAKLREKKRDEAQHFDKNRIHQKLFGKCLNEEKFKTLTFKLVVELLDYPDEDPSFSDRVQRKIGTTIAPFGFVHVALQIGRYVVHWYSNSLVFIRKKRDMPLAILMYSFALGNQFPNTQTNRDKIVDVIYDWNCNKKYDPIYNSCQTFSKALGEAIGINIEQDLSPSYALGRFLAEMSNASAAKHVYPKLIRRDGTVLPNATGWITHTELDEWENSYIPLMKDSFSSDEHAFLKAVHRGFQMRNEPGLGWARDPANARASCSESTVTLTTVRDPYSYDQQQRLQKFFRKAGQLPQHPIVVRDAPEAPGLSVLCLDSCGSRGLYVLELLHRLECQTGRQCVELFDFVCGTGCGAVIAVAAVVLRMPAFRIIEEFRTLGEAFKDKELFASLESVWAEGLSEKLANVKSPKLCLFANDASEPFRNYGESARGTTVRDALMACVHLRPGSNAGRFCNPSVLALRECKRLWPQQRLFCVASFGAEPWIGTHGRWSELLHAQADHAAEIHQQVSTALSNDDVYRRICFPPQFCKFAVSEARMPVFEGANYKERKSTLDSLKHVGMLLMRKGGWKATFRGRPAIVKSFGRDEVELNFTDSGVDYSMALDEFDDFENFWGQAPDIVSEPGVDPLIYRHNIFSKVCKTLDVEFASAENNIQ